MYVDLKWLSGELLLPFGLPGSLRLSSNTKFDHLCSGFRGNPMGDNFDAGLIELSICGFIPINRDFSYSSFPI